MIPKELEKAKLTTEELNSIINSKSLTRYDYSDINRSVESCKWDIVEAQLEKAIRIFRDRCCSKIKYKVGDTRQREEREIFAKIECLNCIHHAEYEDTCEGEFIIGTCPGYYDNADALIPIIEERVKREILEALHRIILVNAWYDRDTSLLNLINKLEEALKQSKEEGDGK